MSEHSQQQERPANPGLFGRIWGKGEGKRKAVKANLGERNKLFYDEKLKRWREEGKEVFQDDLEPPPPPITGSGFSQKSDNQGHRRSASGSRYADAGGFAISKSNASTNPIFPRPNTAPSVQAPLAPSQGASTTAPRFFVPGASSTTAATSNPFAPSWGTAAANQGAPFVAPFGRNPESAIQHAPTSPAAQSQSPLACHSPKPQDARDRDPPKQEDSLSWQQWRQQDEERRGKERQEAAMVGAQVMNSVTLVEEGGGPQTSDTSFTEAVHGQDQEGGSLDTNIWAAGATAEESVGDNIQTSAAASLDPGRAHERSDEAVTSPSRAPPFSPVAELLQGRDQQDPFKDQHDSFAEQPGVEDFFGGVAAEASEATFQEWNAGAEQHDGDASSGEVRQADPTSNEWEQTYGGMTWSQLQEWAQYYRDGGTSEEDIQAWVDGYLAAPDPGPGLYGDGVQAEDQGYQGTLGVVDSAASPREEAAQAVRDSLATTSSDVRAEESLPPENQSRVQNGPASGAPGAHISTPVGEGDLMARLREYISAQRASDPTFGKLVGPLPWDGILTDDEDSPQLSPRLRLDFGRKSSNKVEAAQTLAPSIPQMKEIVNTLSKTANNALGASWLDKIRQNLAEGEGNQQTVHGSDQSVARALEEPRCSTTAAAASTARPLQGKHSAMSTPRASAAEHTTHSLQKTSDVVPKSPALCAGSHRSTPKAADRTADGEEREIPEARPFDHSGSKVLTPRSAPVAGSGHAPATAFGGFDGRDGKSLASTPKSAKSASHAQKAVTRLQASTGGATPNSPLQKPSAPLLRANGHTPKQHHQSASLSDWHLQEQIATGMDFIPLEGPMETGADNSLLEKEKGAEYIARQDYGGWEGAEWGAEEWTSEPLENTTLDPGSTEQERPVMDELTEEAHQLPPLNVQAPAAALIDPSPPLNSSKALVAEVEHLRRQLAGALAAQEKIADEFCTLQDQNGKLEIELADLKAVLDQQQPLPEDRATGGIVQQSATMDTEEEVRDLKVQLEQAKDELSRLSEDQGLWEVQRDAARLALEAQKEELALREEVLASQKETIAKDRVAVEDAISRLMEEQTAIDAQRAALKEEASQLAAEREDLIQENDRMLTDREEIEAERDSARANALHELEALKVERDSLERERAKLQEDRQELVRLQAQVAEKEAAIQSKGVPAEAGTLLASQKEMEAMLGALQDEVEELRTKADNMAVENEELAEENLAKDEEIDKLTGQLVHAQQNLKALELTKNAKWEGGLEMTAEEVAQLREQARLDFQRIAALDEQNQQLQGRIEELEEGGAFSSAADAKNEAVKAERDELERKLTAAEASFVKLQAQYDALKEEHEAISTRFSDEEDRAAALEQEKSASEAQVAVVSAERDALSKDIMTLRKKVASRSQKLGAEIETLKKKLVAAEGAADSGAKAAAEISSLSEQLAAANRKIVSLEAAISDRAGVNESLSEEMQSLQDKLALAAAKAAEAHAEKAALELELQSANAKLQDMEASFNSTDELQAEVAELHRQLSGAEKQTSALQGTVESLSRDLASSEESTAKISREAESGRTQLLQRIDALEKELAEKVELAEKTADERDRLAADAGACREARLEVARAQEEVSSKQSELKTAENRIVELEAREATSQQKCNDLLKRVETLEDELGEAIEVAEAASDERDKLQGDAAACAEARLEATRAHNDLARVKHELEVANSRIGELDAKLAAASSDEALADLSARMDELLNENKLLLNENKLLHRKLAAAEKDVYEHTERIAEVREQLAAAEARLQEVKGDTFAGPLVADLQSAAEEQLAEKEQDLADLMVCLGQETAKVEALSDLLEKQGIHVGDLLEQVEQSFGYGVDAVGEDFRESQEVQKGGSATDLSFLENPLEGAEGDWGL